MTVHYGRERTARDGTAPRPLFVAVAFGLDKFIEYGIALMIFVTPLTVYAGEPWQFSLMELVIFVLVAVWMGRSLLTSQNNRPPCDGLERGLALPLLLFGGIVVAQLMPLPSSLLHVSSPATYELYRESLLGWPRGIPYEELSGLAIQDVRKADSNSVVPQLPRGNLESAGPRNSRKVSSWRSVSIVPEATARSALKLTAYGCLFFLTAFYPFGFAGDRCGRASLCRRAVFAALTIGLFVALIGILRRSTDDGQTLWLFLGQDRQTYDLSTLRASGFFENPDHFANYLDLILPFAVAGFMFPGSFSPGRYEFIFRWFSGCAAVVLVAALLGSASRAGWIGAAISIVCLTSLSGYMPALRWPRPLRMEGWGRALVPALSGAALMLTVVVAGPAARTQADSRIAPSMAREDFTYRLDAARDSLQMIRDFPILGVGLGCWAELFPRYCRPPWSSVWWGEAHNDYVQLLAETGLAGFLCLTWICLCIGKALHRGSPPGDSALFPIFAAILSAIAATVFHELFDFPLHTSADAFLFTLWLGLGVRIAINTDRPEGVPTRAGNSGIWRRAAIGIAAIALALAAITQGEAAYFPYEVQELETPAEVRAFLLDHPANSRAHLILVKLMTGRMPLERVREEAKIALWLEPTNPLARDIYARTLFASGEQERARQQITRSVFFSPDRATHFYLDPDRAKGLSIPERAAVQRGFQLAIERSFPGAAQGMAEFYKSLGEFGKAADTYMVAAARETDSAIRTQYLINAGTAYAQARQWSNAENSLRKAVELDGSEPAPYAALIEMYGSARDVAKAKVVVEQARKQGVDAFSLYAALAQIQLDTGDTSDAQVSLLQATKYRPADFQTLMLLGRLHSQRQEFSQAIKCFKRAVRSDPRSAEAFAELAGAEQGAYDYFEAQHAYRKALELEPKNKVIQRAYEELQRKIQQAEADRQKLQ